MKRSKARESAFILIFENIFNPEYTFEEMRDFAAESEIFEVDAFTEALYTAAVNNTEALDAEIAKYLKNWRIERLSKPALAILRLAFAELIYLGDIPPSVTVNEAVELAKKYAGEKDAPFINGVLGAAVRARQDS
jgi:N utilization substance protein B